MMRHLVEIDRADQVDRTDQLLLDVPGQVAGVEELEPAEGEQKRQAAGIVRAVDGLVRRGSRRTDGLAGFDRSLPESGGYGGLGRPRLPRPAPGPSAPLKRQRVAGFQSVSACPQLAVR